MGFDLKLLNQRAFEARKSILEMSLNGGCFIGASYSCVDILTYLYNGYLNVNINNLKDSNRDYFLISKGHAVPALYAVLAECGIIGKYHLQNHLKSNDYIYWHPNTNIPGIEFHSGSLGHNLSVAIGIALDLKLNKLKNKVVVLLGDGELNEGSNWEGILLASSYKLNNLIIIIDRNHLQANVETEELIKLEPLKAKFEAFNSNTYDIDGHNFESIHKCLNSLVDNSKPHIVIADTVRGKGIPSIERNPSKWYMKISKEEFDELFKELNEYYKEM